MKLITLVCVCASLFLIKTEGLVPEKTSPTIGLRVRFASARIPSGGRNLHSVVYDGDDSVYILGGWDTDYYSTELLRYSLSQDRVHFVGTMRMRSEGGAILSADEEYLIYIGGTSWGDVDYFSLRTGNTTTEGQLPENMWWPAVAWDRNGGAAYAFGGQGPPDRGARARNDILRLDATNYTVEEVARLPEPRYNTAAVWVNGGAYLFGGGPAPLARDILWFDSETRRVTKLDARLPHDLEMVGTGVVYDSDQERVYIIYIDELLCFNPHALNESDAVTILKPDGWPIVFGGTGPVYIPKLRRLYMFGGNGRFEGEMYNRRMPEIMYVDLSGEDGEITTTTTTTTTERPEEPLPDCIGQPDGRPVPDPSCCRSFFICRVGSEPTKLECDPGLHFNPVSRECDAPSRVGCAISYH